MAVMDAIGNPQRPNPPTRRVWPEVILEALRAADGDGNTLLFRRSILFVSRTDLNL